MRRALLILTLVIAAAGAVALYVYTRPLPVLKIVTWSGAYGRAQRVAMIEPYRDVARVDTQPEEWDGDLAEVAHAVAAHTYNKGDVIDFELPKAVQACRQGLLEKFDAATLPAGQDGTAAASDFVPGAVGDCWVGSVAYSQILFFAKNTFSGPDPATLNDFFDTAKYPGPRAMRPIAKFNLEMALLADGVRPSDIYLTLSTEDGVARAFKKLDSIRPVLVWWRNPGEPARMIQDRRAVFATALNGDVFDARAALPGIIWDRQLYEFDVFAVPKGDPNKEMAMDFIRWATGSKPLAGVADWVALGPARRSSWPLVGKNPELGIAMTPYLPTGHFTDAFAVDDGWWLTHGPALEARFQAWMNAPN
ncbi:MAG TPA: extracellular solute-binding protein [Rhizomicrobium sp.]|nr:extracellular solute-binding protein [Rhizomicrobium sp.]